jgi:pantoate--beta-alanine ligase
MRIVEDIREMQTAMEDLRQSGRTIGFAPTLGALHQGHLSLIHAARKACDEVVVSLFVNPIQFGPREDYQDYPRDLPGDTEKCRNAGVDRLFLPPVGQIYPSDYRTFVTVEGLSEILCGVTRPGHFRGVATIVAKLLHIVKPHRLFLGHKDYQQCVILEKMVRDLNLDLEVVRCPTVRESDGLAMSSRNAYLSPEERRAATVLYRSLKAAETAYRMGESRGDALTRLIRNTLEAEPLVGVEYVRILHPGALDDATKADRGSVMALAVRIGRTRLIDNHILGETPAETP